eukprot:scaffold3281_cov55-Attheya_sp.AAC.3
MMISLRFVRVPGGGILAFQEWCCCEYRFPLTHSNASEIVDRTRDCVRQTVQMPHGGDTNFLMDFLSFFLLLVVILLVRQQ